MAKPLTAESKVEEKIDDNGNVTNNVMFQLKLNARTHNKLIDYLILTDRATGRNNLISELIERELDGKVLDNWIIDLYQNPYYFNVTELLENKKVIATKKEPLSNLDEIFVVRRLPNNLDEFNKELKTYCFGNNKHIHAGYYILPKYKDNDEKHFTFRYDSEKEEIEINLVPPTDIDIVFDSLDDEKQNIKRKIIFENVIATNEIENDEITSYDILTTFNIMYSYKANLKLLELAKKKDKLTDEEKAEREKIYFDGVFFK